MIYLMIVNLFVLIIVFAYIAKTRTALVTLCTSLQKTNEVMLLINESIQDEKIIIQVDADLVKAVEMYDECDGIERKDLN